MAHLNDVCQATTMVCVGGKLCSADILASDQWVHSEHQVELPVGGSQHLQPDAVLLRNHFPYALAVLHLDLLASLAVLQAEMESAAAA